MCHVVVNKIQESLNVLYEITAKIPVFNKQSKYKSPFLSNNAFLRGDLGLLIHMIIMNHENEALKWATKKYYEDESRLSHYNKLVKFILDDERLSLARK